MSSLDKYLLCSFIMSLELAVVFRHESRYLSMVLLFMAIVNAVLFIADVKVKAPQQ